MSKVYRVDHTWEADKKVYVVDHTWEADKKVYTPLGSGLELIAEGCQRRYGSARDVGVVAAVRAASGKPGPAM